MNAKRLYIFVISAAVMLAAIKLNYASNKHTGTELPDKVTDIIIGLASDPKQKADFNKSTISDVYDYIEWLANVSDKRIVKIYRPVKHCSNFTNPVSESISLRLRNTNILTIIINLAQKMGKRLGFSQDGTLIIADDVDQYDKAKYYFVEFSDSGAENGYKVTHGTNVWRLDAVQYGGPINSELCSGYSGPRDSVPEKPAVSGVKTPGNNAGK